MRRQTPERGAGRSEAGVLDRVRCRWHGLDRGWQASVLGALLVLVVLAL